MMHPEYRVARAMAGEQNTVRIMVVDDERDLLYMVKTYLEKWGFAIDTFDKPLNALAHFEKHHADYSLVLTDIRMPGMTGIELARLMLMVKPSIKIALMTAYEIQPRELAATLPVVNWEDIVHKPFRLLEICEAVKKQLQTV
jgi:CheY-like chemotaxis protein